MNHNKITEGERFGLLVTIQLALIFVIQLVEQQVPPSGDYSEPMIFGFVRFATIQCVIVLMQSVLLLHIHNNGDIKIPKIFKGEKIKFSNQNMNLLSFINYVNTNFDNSL